MSAGAGALQARAAAARAAQQAWEAAGLETRLKVLCSAWRRLTDERAALHEALRADGLSVDMARSYAAWILAQGEPARLEAYARELAQLRRTGPGGGELLVRRPDGVVLLITPGNSPTINAAALFSLLLPGNAVIARAPDHDRGVRLLVEGALAPALQEHALPAETVGVVTGRSRAVLTALMPDANVATVVFFGNGRAGRAVAEQAHAHGKKVVLELEGSDYMMVWRDADQAGALSSALRALEFSTQPCIVPKHLLVHEVVADPFISALTEAVQARARSVEADPEHGVLAPVAHLEGYFAALDQLRSLGEVIGGGCRVDALGRPDPDGHYLAPTLVALEAEACLGQELLAFREEIAFPLLPVVRFRGGDEAILRDMLALLRASPFGLRASVWAEAPWVLGRVAREVGDVGLLVFNDDHALCPRYASPWGGPKRSGGPDGESRFFWQKASRLQAICCERLTGPQLRQVCEDLGCARLVGLAEAPAPEGSPATIRVEGGPLELSVEQGVARLTLARPARHNAVDNAMLDALGEAVARLEQRADVLRCVVLRGRGPSFCSGADLDALSGLDRDGARRFMFDAAWCFRRLARLPVPVVAAVHGYCLGGGLELALHCDELIALGSARFGFPETGLGLVTTAGSVSRLIDAVGSLRAKRLLLGPVQLDAPRAYEWGLVAQLVEDDRSVDALERAVSERVEALCALPAGGVGAMKRLIDEHGERARRAGWVGELEGFEALLRAQGGRVSRG